MLDFKVKENLQAMKKDQKLFDRIKQLRKVEILVGIPEAKSKRRRGEMNNATLLYIHTKGSPLKNLPARPLIEPALEAPDNSDRIAADLKAVGKAIIEEKFTEAERLMRITGQDAVNMIHNWFDDPRNGWPPDTKETVMAKLRKTKKKLAERQEMINDYLEGKEDINTTLVDTNQMRRSITYVLRKTK